ncbi:MAG: AI-2E family transporter [archaeon]
MKKSGANTDSVTTKEKSFGKYILFGIIILLIFLSYQIVKPYLIVLISSFILAYLSKPVFNFLRPKLGKSIAATLCLLLILAILIIPATLIVTTLAKQASAIVKNTDLMGVVNTITSLPILDQINFNWASGVDRVGLLIFSLVGTVASQLPSMLLSGLVFLFAFFYILVGWDSVTKQVKRFIPFKNKEGISKDISQATHGIVFGYLLIAILDFVVSAIGLYFAGIKFYLLLSFLVAILVFIPGLGPSIVNVPLLAYFALVGNWYSFIIVLITWAIIALFIETFLVTRVLAGRAKIHPLIMLIGILGGTALFGIFGFIIGPLILVYTIELVEELSEQN